MTKRDFFNIIIKLFGLYTVIKLTFAYLPNTLVFAFRNATFSTVLFSIIALSAIIGLNILLIFKSQLVVKWLKLDRNFDDKQISIANMDMVKLLTLGLIIIGGLLIVNNASSLLHEVSSTVVMNSTYYKGAAELSTKIGPSVWINIVFNLLNIILGYFLVVYSNKISQHVGRINNLNEK